MKFNDFLSEHGTRQAHNKGSKLELEGANHLMVYGADSDVGREVTAEKYRLDPKAEDFDEQMKGLFARLVFEWSFDEPIAVDLMIELFTEYPLVYDRVVNFYMNRSNFTKG